MAVERKRLAARAKGSVEICMEGYALGRSEKRGVDEELPVAILGIR
jgi:hypothetical protein